MAERAKPMPIRVRDALFVELRKIGLDDETKWRTVPKTFGLAGSIVEMVNAPKPAVFVATAEKQTVQWTNDIHKDTLQLFVYCASEEPNDPESALWDLMSDVERAIRENLKLGEVLASGYIRDVSCKVHPEATEGKAGFGFGVVQAEAYYQTTDENP